VMTTVLFSKRFIDVLLEPDLLAIKSRSYDLLVCGNSRL
jgi:hypothetical protein